MTKKIKKIVAEGSLLLLVMCFALLIVNFQALPAQAVINPIDDFNESVSGGQVGGSGLTDATGRPHELSAVDPGADVITSVIFTVIDFMKYLIGGIAVIFVIIVGVRLVTAAKKVDEVSEKAKEGLKYIIYGLILIIIADELVTKVFFGEYGECVASASNAKECAKLGGGLLKGIYSFVLSMMGTLAVFILVLTGFRLVTSAGNEEDIGKQKKRMAAAIVGLLVAGIGEFAIKGVIFPEGGTKGIDVAGAQKLVFNFTNFVASFIGASAFIMFFYGGYLYVASFGNEEQTGKAKKIIIGAVVGILIALAAYGIVATITAYNPARTDVNLPGNVPGLP